MHGGKLSHYNWHSINGPCRWEKFPPTPWLLIVSGIPKSCGHAHQIIEIKNNPFWQASDLNSNLTLAPRLILINSLLLLKTDKIKSLSALVVKAPKAVVVPRLTHACSEGAHIHSPRCNRVQMHKTAVTPV